MIQAIELNGWWTKVEGEEMTQTAIKHILNAISKSTLKNSLKTFDVSWLKLKKELLDQMIKEYKLTNLWLK